MSANELVKRLYEAKNEPAPAKEPAQVAEVALDSSRLRRLAKVSAAGDGQSAFKL